MTSYCDYPYDETRCEIHDDKRPCVECENTAFDRALQDRLDEEEQQIFAEAIDRQHDTRKEQESQHQTNKEKTP